MILETTVFEIAWPSKPRFEATGQNALRVLAHKPVTAESNDDHQNYKKTGNLQKHESQLIIHYTYLQIR